VRLLNVTVSWIYEHSREGAGNADLRALLQHEQTWLAQAERTVAEVRAWREREARQFWPGVAQR
jgi:hypothetical protein